MSFYTLHLSQNIITLTSFSLRQCGSPNYVSPEVLDGCGYDGKMSDIWSIGVILIVMTTGRLPFDEHTTSELFAKIQKASFVFPDTVSMAFKDLVSRILVVNPRQRPQLTEIQNHAWYLSDKTLMYS
jgi:serine/threonine protein kinase